MRFLEAWREFWFRPASLERLALFRILLMTLVCVEFIAYEPMLLAGAELAASRVEGAFWNPIFAVSALGLEPPSPELARSVMTVGSIAAACGLLGLLSNLSCAVAGACLVYAAAMVYSFEKVHHDKAALAFTLAVLPFAPIGARWSLDAAILRVLRAWRGGAAPDNSARSQFALFPLRFTQVTLALGYGAAGASKLIVAGPQWANGYTLMSFLAEFDMPATPWFAGGVERMMLFSVFALGVQLGFPSILFWPRLAWFFVPAVVLNHVINWLTLDTGPYASLWFLTIAFVPLERVSAWVRAALRSRRWRRRVLGVMAPLAPAALMSWMWFTHYLPAWSAAVFVPAAATVLLRFSRRRRMRVAFDPRRRRSRVLAAVAETLDWSQRFELQARSSAASIADASVWHVDAAGRTARLPALALLRQLPLLAPLAWLWPSRPRVRPRPDETSAA